MVNKNENNIFETNLIIFRQNGKSLARLMFLGTNVYLAWDINSKYVSNKTAINWSFFF